MESAVEPAHRAFPDVDIHWQPSHRVRALTGKQHNDGKLLELVLEDSSIHREERCERADL